MTEALGSSETSAHIYQITRRHISDDSNLQFFLKGCVDTYTKLQSISYRVWLVPGKEGGHGRLSRPVLSRFPQQVTPTVGMLSGNKLQLSLQSSHNSQ